MLTYELKKSPGVPLYEALYRCIREDILSGKLQPGEKLPSKRALAEHLEVSKITVETAYSQLLSEGYLRSEEKVGYFVETVERLPRKTPLSAPQPPRSPELLDLTGSAGVDTDHRTTDGRLAGAGLTDQGESLALVNIKRSGLYSTDSTVALAKGNVHIFEGQ